jgi:hypothetical protein
MTLFHDCKSHVSSYHHQSNLAALQSNLHLPNNNALVISNVLSTSRKPALLVSYLEYLSDLQRWLSEWRIAINNSRITSIIFGRAGRRIIQPRPVTLFGDKIQWVNTTSYLGVTLEKLLNWSPIDQVRKKTAQRMGLLGPLLNTKSVLSIRHGVLLYKQLIRPMIDYACPSWTSAARTHVRRLQMLQPTCLRLVTDAPCYLSNRQINECLGVPLFADHIRALTASFVSKLAEVGNPLVRQLGRYYSDQGLIPSPDMKAMNSGGQQESRLTNHARRL